MAAATAAERYERISVRPWATYAALAATSIAAAGIHFAVMAEHFQEYAPFGVFFSVVAWLQALWAVGLVFRPSRWLLAAGLIGNLAVVAVWVVSRTTGLPLGPEPGVAEAASFIDVLSTVLEALIVVGCGVLLARPGSSALLRGRTGWIGVLVLVLALATLTTSAIASSGGHGEEAAGHDGDHAEGGSDQPGISVVDLGAGRTLQALVDTPEGGPAQIHLTFFDASGGALDVTSVKLRGTSPSDSSRKIPMSEFETGHYAATKASDLEPGAWSFDLKAVTRDGEEIATTFGVDVG